MIDVYFTSGLRPVCVRFASSWDFCKPLIYWVRPVRPVENVFFSRARARACVTLIFNWTYWTTGRNDLGCAA